jgi:ATP-dependent Clp protease ATP-binding subunit ClpX
LQFIIIIKFYQKQVESTSDVEIERVISSWLVKQVRVKHYLQSYCTFANLLVAIVDATVFTEAGYVGEDVESILTRFYKFVV